MSHTHPQVPPATARVHFRLLTHSDASFIISLLNTPGWLQFIGDRKVHTDDQACTYITNGPAASYRTHGFGLWVLALNDVQHTPIGLCGLLQRDYLANPDLGYALLPEHMRKGYMYEAAMATIAFARNVLRIEKVSAIVQPGNEASEGLLRKCGLEVVGSVTAPTSGEQLVHYCASLKQSD